jgi:hypothetical protein
MKEKKKKECEEHVSELISLPGRVMRVGEASDEAVCKGSTH